MRVLRPVTTASREVRRIICVKGKRVHTAHMKPGIWSRVARIKERAVKVSVATILVKLRMRNDRNGMMVRWPEPITSRTERRIRRPNTMIAAPRSRQNAETTNIHSTGASDEHEPGEFMSTQALRPRMTSMLVNPKDHPRQPTPDP